MVVAIAIGADTSEFKVTVSGTHLCCGACENAAKKAVAKVEGVKGTIDADEGKIVLVGKNKESVQKAIDEIALAGFHGKLDSKEVAYKAVKVPDGKAKMLEFVEVHNCCTACTDAIKDAIKKIDGVKSDTVTSKKTTFVVEGDFNSKELVASLLGAGFHCKIKGEKE